MTYTEIIDNIQTRIENLIAERFSGTYMNIKIDPSKYNPDIDEEITVTITVTDQNDDPISNWNVPLTINGTAVATTLTTDTNGQVTYTHSCDDWGIYRFSVKSFSCQINVIGWRQVHTSSDGKLKTYQSDDKVRIVSSGYNVSATTTWARVGSSSFLSQVKPSMPVVQINNDYTILFRVDNNGDLYFRSVTGSVSNKNNYFQMDWTI